MVYLTDKENPNGAAVRAFLYEDESELRGLRINTENAGIVDAEPGSVAFKAGFSNMKQLDASGSWRDC